MGTKMLQNYSLGGDKRSRTADLLHAMQALYQLSYTPESRRARIVLMRLILVKYFLKFLQNFSKKLQALAHKYFFMRCKTTARGNKATTASTEGVCV